MPVRQRVTSCPQIVEQVKFVSHRENYRFVVVIGSVETVDNCCLCWSAA